VDDVNVASKVAGFVTPDAFLKRPYFLQCFYGTVYGLDVYAGNVSDA